MAKVTTHAIGEEEPVYTSDAIGEEDTTFAVGEEDTTHAVGEEGPIYTTDAIGEEGPGPIEESESAFGSF